ncbi:hypothetical protein I3760_04G072700 [Carya illinoinensis]|nr:hypothetical protein I3760_04G072700 [Carya illinoinensis]KAG2711344.1 hypothetical protein I3760_04G072700 [Carya illinoinensis]KAG2711345.1 hypothetical protein I3760_04G072700 [Carya illinoinensis]
MLLFKKKFFWSLSKPAQTPRELSLSSALPQKPAPLLSLSVATVQCACRAHPAQTSTGVGTMTPSNVSKPQISERDPFSFPFVPTSPSAFEGEDTSLSIYFASLCLTLSLSFYLSRVWGIW